MLLLGGCSQIKEIKSEVTWTIELNWTEESTWTDKSKIGMANPASVYCIEHYWKIEIRIDQSGWQYWVCKFEDWSECGEREYYRWECKIGDTLVTETGNMSINNDFR